MNGRVCVRWAPPVCEKGGKPASVHCQVLRQAVRAVLGVVMSGFVSTYTKKLDAKGRVSIPAPFRAALARDAFDGLYCYPSLDMQAVDAGGNGLLGEIERRLQRYESFTEEHDYLSTAFYGMSEVLNIDGDGRVILSDAIKDYAGIDGEVSFVGQGYKFQIWEPSRFDLHRKEARERALALRKPAAPEGVQ